MNNEQNNNMSDSKVYTEQELYNQKEFDHLGEADLIEFDLANPKCEGFVLLGWDEIGMFAKGMKKPRYRFEKN